jgi:colanic acid biosynthesis glycosyl transferase WcaI
VKILYISQYFPPEMGAPAARAAELSRHWARDGHEVTVLTGFPNHPTGLVPAEYRAKFRRLVSREMIDGVSVIRTWLFPFPNRRVYERMLNYSSFCASSASTGVFLSRHDVIIATSPQLLVGLSGWWLARCKRVPLVFEVRDLWPESLAAVGMGTRDSLLHRSLARVAGFLYRNSQHIVVVSPPFKDYLITHWNVPRDKISIVENGVEANLFSPQNSDSELRRMLGIEDKFVVCYIGTLGMAHGLKTVLEAASRLQHTAPEVVFLLIGEGAEKSRMMSVARERRLNNVRFLHQQPREQIPAYICASDACLVTLKKNEIFKTVIPTKMLEFMSCARPVILGVDGQARRIVEDARAGIFVEPENSEQIANAITQLSSSGELRELLGRNGRRHIIQHFSRSETARAYICILEELLGNTGQQAAAA